MKRALIAALIVGIILVYFKTKQTPIPEEIVTTKEEGNVTAIVELLKEKSNKQKLVFNVILDTHSVDLNIFDLENNVFMEKNGSKIKPQQVNVSGNIHHKTAEVVFKIFPTPFTITITNLDNVSKREFKFN